MNSPHLVTYPLTGYDMMELNPDAKLITYDELNSTFDIMDLFHDTDKIILLYLLFNNHSGHYVCLFLNDEGLNFYDDYGLLPDAELQALSSLERQRYNEKTDRLKLLLSKYKVIYNRKRLQKPNTMTCGCYVSHRLNHYQIPQNEYIRRLMRASDGNTDLYVARWCLDRLN